MRNATILVLTIRGLATEVIKNIVLAGVGKLIIADNEDVKEEDLGTGFFFRDEDLGRKARFLTPRHELPSSSTSSSDHRMLITALSEGRCGQTEGRKS